MAFVLQQVPEQRAPGILKQFSLLLVFAGALCLVTRLSAQTDSGTIVGTVKDSTGATVNEATVTLANIATSVSRTTITNNSGEYQFPAITPGTYSVKAARTGFATAARNDVEVHVQSRIAVDFDLKIGEVNQVMEVTSASPLLQTESADVGGVVAEKQIRDLPLNGRRYSDLALLEPGIQRNYANINNTAPDRFSSNGNLETQNYFSLDGVDNNSGSTNLQEGSTQAVQPPPDALQEFRVQTRTYSAEFGTSAGAVINASLKSGTNGFHGNVWEFLRNDKLDANFFFNNAGNIKRGRFNQNQFGGTIGGPIIKNVTFFFFDAQQFTSRKATTTLSTVPTAAMKQGNFNELRTSLADPRVAGQSGCISGNVVRPSCIDPVGLRLLSLFPSANIPAAVAPEGTARSWTGAQNYQFQYSLPTDIFSYDTRIDHNFSPNMRLFGRFSDYAVDRQDSPWTSDPVVGNGNFATQYNIRGKSVALTLNNVISPSLVNEIRGGFSRTNARSNPLGLELGESVAAANGLAGIPITPNSAGLPPINITGLTRLGSSPWRPQYQVAQVWQLIDTLSWLKGDHALKMGYEYRHTSNNFLDAQSPQGQITASGIYTGNTGIGVADFLLGNVSTAQLTTATVVHNYQRANNIFVQDSWRAKSNLTINFGARYELFSPILNHQNQMANFTPDNGGGFVYSKSSGSWYDRSLIRPDKNNIAPRIGFSYQPMKRLVLRGGYGVFYQHRSRIGSESVLALNPPFFIDGSLVQTAGSVTPVFQLRNGFPSSSFTPALVNLTRLQIRAQDANQRTGYVNQTSFGAQVELTQSTILDVSWVGNFGRKMNRLRNANQGQVISVSPAGVVARFPYANLNTSTVAVNAAGNHSFLQLATNDGNTNYNGLLVSLRKRFSKGLSYGVSYTWSHNFSDFVDNLTAGSTPQNAYNYSLERSNSPFDVRHRMTGNVAWAIPVGKDGMILANRGRLSNAVGGWQLNSIVTLQTGTPFSVTSNDNSGTGGNHLARANCNADAYAGATSDRSQFVGTSAPGFFLNPAAFSIPTAGTFGTCAPRAFHGPGLQTVDLSLFKSFFFGERWRLEFRSEFFNAFNRANFQNPASAFVPASLVAFGKSTATVTDPREIQFALKLYF